jgi:hypothetical protein
MLVYDTAKAKRRRALAAAAAMLLEMHESRRGSSGNRSRNRNKQRNRMDWGKHVEAIGEATFKRAYRLTVASFDRLLAEISDELEASNVQKAINSSGSTILPATCLAMALRFLAGGSYVDICFTHGVAVPTFYEKLWITLEAINSVEKIEFPIDNMQKLGDIARGFQNRSGCVFRSCVGAIDGLSIRTREPYKSETPHPAQYKNRKGFFSVNVQAIADSDYVFTHVSMETAGTTHDWLSWQCSPLFHLLQEKGLPGGFWIAADDAYVCSSYMLTPYPGRNIGQEKDTFNFFQSSCRIYIEQAFGILVRRWGILWRRLEMAMDRWPLVILCCMKLHNICCRDRIAFDFPLGRMATFGQGRPTIGDNVSVEDVITYLDSARVTDPWDHSRRHREREPSEYRNLIAKELSDYGFTRPGYSNYSCA